MAGARYFNFNKQVFRYSPFIRKSLGRHFDKTVQKVHFMCTYRGVQKTQSIHVGAYLV